MSKLLHAMASVFSSKQSSTERLRVGVFSVVHGKRGSLEKLGTRSANTKCAGECTCRCCK